MVLVKKLIELHGGTVRTESTAGLGTRVCVRLPAGPGIRQRRPRRKADLERTAEPKPAIASMLLAPTIRERAEIE